MARVYIEPLGGIGHLPFQRRHAVGLFLDARMVQVADAGVFKLFLIDMDLSYLSAAKPRVNRGYTKILYHIYRKKQSFFKNLPESR